MNKFQSEKPKCSGMAKTKVFQSSHKLPTLPLKEIIFATSPQQTGTQIKKKSGSEQKGIQSTFKPF